MKKDSEFSPFLFIVCMELLLALGLLLWVIWVIFTAPQGLTP